MSKIYGHRGAKGSYPENSMLAFKQAIEVGVHGMEFDVHMTKDGELVVIHDATLDRTTTGSGYVKDYTLAEIQEFSIGAKYTEYQHYEPGWDNERVPTLAEVLTLCLAHNLEVNIELKTHEIIYPDIEAKLLQEVARSGYDPKKVIYSSFHLPTILRIQKADTTALVAWLLENFIPMPIDYLVTLQLGALHMDKDIILAAPAYWRPIADKLRVWTVNDETELQMLLELGVAAIITDYPEIAIKLLKEENKNGCSF